ncbi:adhesin transport system membrane fusion protein [Rheinheimera pacifica]|uniref:HlyD family type I secretion periplasmic adaptor subunit n=1 Tax=Rheinheimera pacifica TaxID=173990 RepID=UPI0021691963|nr:HlyD family type I secretion periplasmic adaptor subunit [Rheinheimera pacifica]MCS4305868.1 adhesin transport system membrane fusion protein [Rheinheimera pacifica]
MANTRQQQTEQLIASALDDNSQYSEAVLCRTTRIISLSALVLLVLLVWAVFARLDEVSAGTGKVVPSAREQIIQSLEGGILTELTVREGAQVEAGQILARLDATRTESNLGESAARYRAALASAARLAAEVNETELIFPAELQDFPLLIAAETRLYQSRRRWLEQTQAGIEQSLKLVEQELLLTRSLQDSGAASNVEVLRLQRQQAELQLKLTELNTQYLVQAREELAKASAEADLQTSVLRGRSDTLSRLTHRSPVRGIVKDIAVTTIGGVIPPNGQLMQIVPVDDHLLIEARIAPRDIAFIHPGQQAMVKITAYDYAIYGGLAGEVVTISPDTLQDEVKPDVFYYRVYIRTEADFLQNKAGQHFAIVPGMIATVDIKTGNKTVMDYLLKPFNRAKEALRER